MAARHYGVPMISIRDGVCPLVFLGELAPKDYWPDGVHPNDRGHGLIAAFLTAYLEEARTHAASDSEELPEKPLFGRRFARADLLTNREIVPVSLGSFVKDDQAFYRFPNGWRYDGIGEEPLVFKVKAQNVGILYQMVTKDDYGAADVRVQSPQGATIGEKRISSNFSGGWGCYPAYEMAAESVAPQEMALEIRPASGQKFSVLGIMIA